MHRIRLPLVCAAFFLAACNDKPAGPPPPDEYIIDCDSADAGEPSASDENYGKFIEAEAAHTVASDPCQSPNLTMPSPGMLSAAAPPMFAFTPTHTTCGLAPRRLLEWACAQRRSRSLLRQVLDFFALEHTAEAHCGAFTGENYLFRLMHAGEAKAAYAAMLSVTSFTPDMGIWTRAMMGRRGQTLTLTIERGIFFRGDIMNAYTQPQPWTFTVGP